MRYEEIGKKIKEIRKSKQITQDDLAQNAGVSRVTISKLENNHLTNISVSVLSKILARLELELDFKEVGALPVFEDILKEFN